MKEINPTARSLLDTHFAGLRPRVGEKIPFPKASRKSNAVIDEISVFAFCSTRCSPHSPPTRTPTYFSNLYIAGMREFPSRAVDVHELSTTPGNGLQYGAFNFLHLGSNEEQPYHRLWQSAARRKPLTRANGSPRFRSSGNISAEKAIFNGLLVGAVRKYGFIGPLNESLTRRSIICNSGTSNGWNGAAKFII